MSERWGERERKTERKRKEREKERRPARLYVCHLNNTLDTFNLQEHKRRVLRLRESGCGEAQCPWSS